MSCSSKSSNSNSSSEQRQSGGGSVQLKMASDIEACVNDPNFAVICSFIEQFGKFAGLDAPDIASLQDMLENTQEVPRELMDFHIKLLRKARKSVNPSRWEKALVKFCHSYSNQDGWELERIGYKKSRVAVKLRVLKALLEAQFDKNQKFKSEINKLSANELRLQPLGRDKSGLSYWLQLDEECNLRVYKEDLDEESWELIAQNRDQMVALVNQLTDGKIGHIPIIDADSDSCEESEKPTIDTGQNENNVNGEGSESDATKNESGLNKQNIDEEVEEEEEDDEDGENDEEEEEEDEEEDEDEDEQESDEDDSGTENIDEGNEKKQAVVEPASHTILQHKATPIQAVPKLQTEKMKSVVKNGVPAVKELAPEIKSIETPVITTSPLKLVNINDLKHSPEKKPNETSSNIGKVNNPPFNAAIESNSGHNKLPVKPISQLETNVARMHSQKSEKPQSKLDKIAENLAKGQVGLHGVSANGEDNVRPPRSHRGIDLSAAPRGWAENPNDQPVDFSGVDLSSRRQLNAPSYRPQNLASVHQQKEMDLSTRKAKSKSHASLPAYDPAYDPRALALLRNHPVVADLSKHSLGYSPYELPTVGPPGMPYPTAQQQQRLPSYAMLHDPSKLTSLRMSQSGVLKRPLETEAADAMLKRMRAADARRDSSKWRGEVGEATEEPVMMIHGEGSGADCKAVFSEAIEEPVMYIYGDGAGADCDTGNPADEGKEDDKSPNKPKFKLGVQTFDQSNTTTSKRSSRWDVGGPTLSEKPTEPPKFFFGPNCVAYGATSDPNDDKKLNDIKNVPMSEQNQSDKVILKEESTEKVNDSDVHIPVEDKILNIETEIKERKMPKNLEIKSTEKLSEDFKETQAATSLTEGIAERSLEDLEKEHIPTDLKNKEITETQDSKEQIEFTPQNAQKGSDELKKESESSEKLSVNLLQEQETSESIIVEESSEMTESECRPVIATLHKEEANPQNEIQEDKIDVASREMTDEETNEFPSAFDKEESTLPDKTDESNDTVRTSTAQEDSEPSWLPTLQSDDAVDNAQTMQKRSEDELNKTKSDINFKVCHKDLPPGTITESEIVQENVETKSKDIEESSGHLSERADAGFIEFGSKVESVKFVEPETDRTENRSSFEDVFETKESSSNLLTTFEKDKIESVDTTKSVSSSSSKQLEIADDPILMKIPDNESKVDEVQKMSQESTKELENEIEIETKTTSEADKIESSNEEKEADLNAEAERKLEERVLAKSPVSEDALPTTSLSPTKEDKFSFPSSDAELDDTVKMEESLVNESICENLPNQVLQDDRCNEKQAKKEKNNFLNEHEESNEKNNELPPPSNLTIENVRRKAAETAFEPSNIYFKKIDERSIESSLIVECASTRTDDDMTMVTDDKSNDSIKDDESEILLDTPINEDQVPKELNLLQNEEKDPLVQESCIQVSQTIPNDRLEEEKRAKLIDESEEEISIGEKNKLKDFEEKCIEQCSIEKSEKQKVVAEKIYVNKIPSNAQNEHTSLVPNYDSDSKESAAVINSEKIGSEKIIVAEKLFENDNLPESSDSSQVVKYDKKLDKLDISQIETKDADKSKGEKLALKDTTTHDKMSCQSLSKTDERNETIFDTLTSKNVTNETSLVNHDGEAEQIGLNNLTNSISSDQETSSDERKSEAVPKEDTTTKTDFITDEINEKNLCSVELEEKVLLIKNENEKVNKIPDKTALETEQLKEFSKENEVMACQVKTPNSIGFEKKLTLFNDTPNLLETKYEISKNDLSEKQLSVDKDAPKKTGKNDENVIQDQVSGENRYQSSKEKVQKFSQIQSKITLKEDKESPKELSSEEFIDSPDEDDVKVDTKLDLGLKRSLKNQESKVDINCAIESVENPVTTPAISDKVSTESTEVPLLAGKNKLPVSIEERSEKLEEPLQQDSLISDAEKPVQSKMDNQNVAAEVTANDKKIEEPISAPLSTQVKAKKIIEKSSELSETLSEPSVESQKRTEEVPHASSLEIPSKTQEPVTDSMVKSPSELVCDEPSEVHDEKLKKIQLDPCISEPPETVMAPKIVGKSPARKLKETQHDLETSKALEDKVETKITSEASTENESSAGQSNDESMFDAPPLDEVGPIDSESADESLVPVSCDIDPLRISPEPPAISKADSLMEPPEAPPEIPQRVTRQSRKRRNSAQEVEEDASSRVQTEEEGTVNKRMKLRGKRPVDQKLREKVEKSRKISASSEDDSKKSNTTTAKVGAKEVETKLTESKTPVASAAKKSKSKAKGRKRKGGYKGKASPRKVPAKSASEAADVDTPNEITSDQNVGATDESSTKQPEVAETKSPAKTDSKKQRKKRNLLGLEIPEEDIAAVVAESEMPVRASRRIAQIRIKKEADKSLIEEMAKAQIEMESKKNKKVKEDNDVSDKKKRKKRKQESEEDDRAMKELEEKSQKKHKKRKKKKLAAKFNEAKPWQSSSGSSSDENVEHEEEEEEYEIESDGDRLVFKSDHEFSPESDLEKEEEKAEPLRRARTAQKPKSDDEGADDEYACQKCNKNDHPEWILLCDDCDQGWHCSCLRPALMIIPEGDWYCPPCQHKALVVKLQEKLKIFDVQTKKHENEILRKKRLAYVGISLENVLLEEGGRNQGRSRRRSRGSSLEDDSSEGSSSNGSSSDESSSDESEPVYQLRERRCANASYNFTEYDNMINAAIKDEVDAVKGAGNQGRGKDISTIVNADLEEKAQLEAMQQLKQDEEEEEGVEPKSEKESDEEFKLDKEEEEVEDEEDEDENVGAKAATAQQKLIARKKHRKLNSLDVSSEDDDYGDEDFKGSSSEEEEEDPDEQGSTSDSEMGGRRRGRDTRPVRRSTRERRTTRYDKEFIDDDSDDSDKPKRKKSRSGWGAESESEESDNSWRQKKKKSRKSSSSRRFVPKVKSSKKKKKRKRIITHDSEDDEEEQQPKSHDDNRQETNPALQSQSMEIGTDANDVATNPDDDQNPRSLTTESAPTDPTLDPTGAAASAAGTQQDDGEFKKKKKEPKEKKIRRKVVYGRIRDADEIEEEEMTMGRRTRGRKVSYLNAMPSDSDEELQKALRKTEDAEDEFVVNEPDELIDDADKDSDSGDMYSPKQQSLRGRSGSVKGGGRGRGKRSPGAKRKSLSDDGTPKQRKKPGPKPGTTKQKKLIPGEEEEDLSAAIDPSIINDADMLSGMNVDDPVQGVMPGNVTGEGSLASLGPSELEGLDEEQLDQMMMEDEEYGRRQLELAAIEISKKKKKEEREAKKLEKARQKALEILAAERDGINSEDYDEPRKKKRGRRSKAEILAEQMRRESIGLPPEPTIPAPQPPPLPMPISSAPVSVPALVSVPVQVQSQVPSQPPSQVPPQIPQQQGPPQLPVQVPPQAPVHPPPQLPVHVPTEVMTGVPTMPVSLMEPSCEPRLMDNPMMPMMSPQVNLPTDYANQSQMMEGGSPMFNPDGSPVKPKRRGRGKGKKTLAMEAARAAEAAAKIAAEQGLLGIPPTPAESGPNPELSKLEEMQASVLPPGSNASPSTTPAPPTNQPPAQPSVYPNLPSQQQSSVITRMLHAQPPMPNSPQSFTAAAANMAHKYFGPPNSAGPMMGGPRPSYDMQNRVRMPASYPPPGSQQPMPPHYAAVRSGAPGMRLRVPGPASGLYTTHHPMDPSPSGGGPITITSRGGPPPPPADRSSPLAHGAPPTMIPPSAGSPLAKGGPTPPPPYNRRFGEPMGSPRHPLPPFTSASLQQPSPPTSRTPGNFSPYHPPPPPNYHYGPAYPGPPMSMAEEAAAAYQGSPYSGTSDPHYSSRSGAPEQVPPRPPPQRPPTQPPTQAPPNAQLPPQGPHPGHPGHHYGKRDEEGTSEFGGLVSYFSSQREDDIES